METESKKWATMENRVDPSYKIFAKPNPNKESVSIYKQHNIKSVKKHMNSCVFLDLFFHYIRYDFLSVAIFMVVYKYNIFFS
jgi:hypothetical protein